MISRKFQPFRKGTRERPWEMKAWSSSLSKWETSFTETGNRKGGGSGRRTFALASCQLQRSRNGKQGWSRTKKRALERSLESPETTSGQSGKKVWGGGRWFRDAGRPRTGPHEPPHQKRQSWARLMCLSSVRDLFLFSRSSYLLELENPQWLLQMNCSLLHFLLQISAFRHYLGPQLLEHVSYRLHSKKLFLGTVSEHVLPLPGTTTRAPLTSLVINRTGDHYTGAQCWFVLRDSLDHRTHEERTVCLKGVGEAKQETNSRVKNVR